MSQGQRLVIWMLAMVGVVVGLNLMVLAALESRRGADGARAPRARDHEDVPGGDGTLRVRGIEVVDGEGRVMIRLGIQAGGDAAIVTTSRDGTPLAYMGQQDGAGMLATFDARGRARAVIPGDGPTGTDPTPPAAPADR